MEKCNPYALSLKSFSYRKIGRKIRQAVISCQRMCEHRKDIPSSLMIYKQFRHPIWRLKYYSAFTDPRYAYPKSRRIINLVTDPYRKLARHDDLACDGFLGYMPITSTLRTRPKYSVHDRRPLRYSPTLCLKRFSPTRLVPTQPLRRYETEMPQRNLTRDYEYLYEKRNGRANESSYIGLKTSLLCRTSAYMFPIRNEQPRNPRATARLAGRMTSLYSNRTMESETSRNFGLKSGLLTHASGYKYAQLSGSSEVRINQRLNSHLYLNDPVNFRPTARISPVIVPAVINSKFSDWSKPFLPNKLLGPTKNRTSFHKINYDESVTTSYVGLPKRFLHIRETELASSYNPRVSTKKYLIKFNKSLDPAQTISGISRRSPCRSEILPVTNHDVSLRLRLGMKLSSSSMSRLYPNDNIILANLDIPASSRSKKVVKEIQDELNDDLKAIANVRMYYLVPPEKKRLVGPPRMTYYSTQHILKPILPQRKRINYPHYYPPGARTNEEMLVLRPMPRHDSKFYMSNKRKGLPYLEDREALDAATHPRLLSSANNYSQLHGAHPENLPGSDVVQRLKLSLRSSTSKVADLYASYAAPNTLTPPPSARRNKTQSVKSMSRSWIVPAKYSVDSYVPRLKIVKSAASRNRTNLHGLP